MRKLVLLLAAMAFALVVASGLVFAQGSTANPGYHNTDPVALGDTDRSATVTDGPVADGDLSAAAVVSNGGFEAGDLSGWNVTNRRQGESRGNWFAYRGRRSPLSDIGIAAPPRGIFAATTDQDGPGSHVLYRNIRLEPDMTHRLSFSLYYRNLAGAFDTPRTLDFRTEPNQQYRVDVMKPSAGLFSVKNSDVLAKVFRTEVGDPNRLAPTPMTYDLTPFAGRTVRLRFAEVDNQSNFLASVDQVKVTSVSR